MRTVNHKAYACIVLLAAVFLTAGCGDDGSPVTPEEDTAVFKTLTTPENLIYNLVRVQREVKSTTRPKPATERNNWVSRLEASIRDVLVCVRGYHLPTGRGIVYFYVKVNANLTPLVFKQRGHILVLRLGPTIKYNRKTFRDTSIIQHLPGQCRVIIV